MYRFSLFERLRPCYVEANLAATAAARTGHTLGVKEVPTSKGDLYTFQWFAPSEKSGVLWRSEARSSPSLSAKAKETGAVDL